VIHSVESDNDLIKAFKQGGSSAFGELYARHKDRAYFYAQALLGNSHAAEEAVQEAFMVFIERADRYEPRGSFRSYLLSVVRSRAVDAMRKHRSGRDARQGYSAELFEVPAEEKDLYPQKETCSRVGGALFELPAEQREAVVLKIYDRMTFAEIAGLTGVSVNTVASRYRYACDKLKEKLKGIAIHER